MRVAERQRGDLVHRGKYAVLAIFTVPAKSASEWFGQANRSHVIAVGFTKFCEHAYNRPDHAIFIRRAGNRSISTSRARVTHEPMNEKGPRKMMIPPWSYDYSHA